MQSSKKQSLTKDIFTKSLFLFILTCFIAAAAISQAKYKVTGTVSGKVIGILDGDTYDLLVNGNQTVRVRMEGIDAPERGMPFYKKAKKYLSDLCFGKNVRLEIHDTDQYGRKIAFTYLPDGSELSHEMIKAGMAWHFTKYNRDADLQKLEDVAKANRTGLWIDKNPMAPWLNRAYHRRGISTKDSFDIRTGNK